MPVKVQALPEGTCIHARVPIFQACAADAGKTTADGPLFRGCFADGARVLPCSPLPAACPGAVAIHAFATLPFSSFPARPAPVPQITAEGPYAPLCTYLETLLTQVRAISSDRPCTLI